MLFPVYWMFAVSLKTPREIFKYPPAWYPATPQFNNFLVLFRDGDVWTIWNSFVIASTSTLIAMVLGTMCAYSIVRFRTGGENLAVWILSQRLLPPIAVVFPIFLIYAQLGLTDTYAGLILLYVAFALPYVIWVMRGYIQDIPVELEESAMVDGATRWQVLWRVVVPVARNGIFATAVFAFIFSWNEFLFALVLTRSQVLTYPGAGQPVFRRAVDVLGEDLGDVGARHAAGLLRGRGVPALSRARHFARRREGLSPMSSNRWSSSMTLGPNEALIGKAYAAELQTPALLLDLDAFEANLKAMADVVSRHGRKLRPHVKAHKSTRDRRGVRSRQARSASAAPRCARRRRWPPRGSTEFWSRRRSSTPSMIERLVAAREKIADLAVVVDSEAGVDALAQLATPERPIGVLVEIDMGQTRTGVTDPDDAVRLARRAADQPSLRYRGVQAYYGHLQHVPTLAERLEKVREKWALLATFTDALRAAGLPAGDHLRRRHRHAPSRPRTRTVHRNPAGLLPLHGQAVRRDRARAGRRAVPHRADDRRPRGQHRRSRTASSSTPA